jgi:hypothetical protein
MPKMINRLIGVAREFVARLHLGFQTIPVFIVFVGFFALGILSLGLGFFQDDWNHVYYFHHLGFEGLRHALFFDSRPLAFVTFDAFFALFGARPPLWHLALLILRTLTALAFWKILNIVWTGFAKENAVVALLFLLYPVYLLQPLSVAFSLHWAMYLVYMLSVILMLVALRRGDRRLPLTLGAVFYRSFIY